MLRAIRRLSAETPLRYVPTFLGAHEVPDEYRDRRDDYVALIVNEMLPGRMRRVGQLVWSGGGGWLWLRGDRQDPARFGILDLVG